MDWIQLFFIWNNAVQFQCLLMVKNLLQLLQKKVSTCKRLSTYSLYNWKTVRMNVMPVILTECRGPPGLKTINCHSLRGRARVITLRTVVPCFSCRPTCHSSVHSAVDHLFSYSGSAFSELKTYCSHNPRQTPSQETAWRPALGAEAQISKVNSTGHSLLWGVKHAEGRKGWGLVWTPTICWIASTPVICCVAKPVVYIEVFRSNEEGMIACNLTGIWSALLSVSRKNAIFCYSNTNLKTFFTDSSDNKFTVSLFFTGLNVLTFNYC